MIGRLLFRGVVPFHFIDETVRTQGRRRFNCPSDVYKTCTIWKTYKSLNDETIKYLHGKFDLYRIYESNRRIPQIVIINNI